ncbi:MAG TPA: glycoside hydrolase family 9 protein [Gemmatimonadaceae bacterium]|nr:glycoside hydrolase family 9 protein [Gemmatimonadaceae bacterium]
MKSVVSSARGIRGARFILAASALLATPVAAQVAPPAASPARAYLRVNQLGYLPDSPKVAVGCALAPAAMTRFTVADTAGRTVFTGRATRDSAFGPCVHTWRLDFSSLRTPGSYRLVAGSDTSRAFRISASAYRGAADTLLYYMREQRSGYNPVFRTTVHTRDGIIVDHPARGGEFVAVTGGWADASDYLQYVTTSANATFVMLMAYRDHGASFADNFSGTGDPGSNGVSDVLDEARHGLEWLLRMFPGDSLMFNQVGDDRDHAFPDLPTTDSSDYGWGKGGPRPVYPCTGSPQGLLRHVNRSDGYASTAGKYAAAFALAAAIYADGDSAFSAMLRDRAVAAYALGKQFPGVCQTAPGGAPYFYEEDNWLDDMELGAAELFALTGEQGYLHDALDFAAREPVTPWMGADTASHYQWFPWHNNGHHEIWRTTSGDDRTRMADYYRRGLAAVAVRADATGGGFRVGVPFIWCSNNLMASFATQAFLYRRMTGDERFRVYEQAAIDWLFGVNPWGVSMVIGLPHDGVTARDPHSVVTRQTGLELTGGLLDGPVYASIYRNLLGIRLFEADEYAPFNTGFIVYHDDYGDYSTNEPIMDGTANLTWLLAALAADRPVSPDR